VRQFKAKKYNFKIINKLRWKRWLQDKQRACGFLPTTKKIRQGKKVILHAVYTVPLASFDHSGLT